MSRLINADALKSNMFNYAPPEMTWDRGDIEHKIDEMPTVDAIPIEWLEKYDSEYISDRSGNVYGRRYITISEALSIWRKEQETR